MKKPREVREHEVAFCADVKSWADALFTAHPEWPFTHAKIEQYGTGNNKRSDLRIFRGGSSTPVLAGEVKLPGTPEGRTPYDPALMQDSFNKADNIQAPYFFTWNVNTFVLFDRSRWNLPMIQRRLWDWNLGLNLTSPGDCRRPEVQARIREKFLPDVFDYLARIVQGKIVEWGKPPDDIFISSLESHLDWPVNGTRDYLAVTAEEDRTFAATLHSWMSEEMGWTFDPEDPENWRDTLEQAARTLCYVFCNRAIFYEAIRAKYAGQLNELRMPKRGRHGHKGIYDYFRHEFHRAVRESGDYEPIFYPHVDDWAGALVFASDIACQGWTGLFTNLAEYNFRQIPHDILGGIFQKLISPEERQKFGQFYTNEDIVDIVNAFCIHRAGDVVIDPACGSGSFLVRAYHRKAWLAEHRTGARGHRHHDSRKDHQELLREIYGSDIALFAAHLATLNLAARHIEEEENYPYIARTNFFEVPEHRGSFCTVPGLRQPNGQRDTVAVALPDVDAVIGNPPYVRQERVPRRDELKRQKGETREAYKARQKTTKEFLQQLCKELWPGLRLPGRSDLHCYFWPAAASLLRNGGYFGFLTSSSWLDVEYGFALQGWALKNFKVIAVIESLDEPWFQDARVKTAITILQRCADEPDRMANVVKFVRLFKPVKSVLGERPHGDETARQDAAESLRRLILQTKSPFSNDELRIIPVPQSQLWEEGVRAGRLLKEAHVAEPDSEEEQEESGSVLKEAAAMYTIGSDYAAGKWGRFLRAPDLYFRLVRDFRSSFVRLGEIAEVKRGITSGCDAFFMPRDITAQILKQLSEGLPWNHVGLMTPCKRSELEAGKVRIVKAGDNTLHPVETEYLRPEVHSLMEVHKPVIRASDLQRVVLWVDKPLSELAHTYAAKYIGWGAKQTFPSEKSKAVPVPLRTSCAARPLWYDLTNIGAGTTFWPMAHKYRHIAPANPDHLICNHNLFYVRAKGLNPHESKALAGILNSTIVALFKHFYGRYAGSEGTLKTEVVDTVLLEVPSPRGISAALAERLSKALDKMAERSVTHLVEEALLQCHSEEAMRTILSTPPELPTELRQQDRYDLDDCILELIGVAPQEHRQQLLQELYLETANYYRYQRTQDIQAMANRSGRTNRRLGPQDLADSIWHSLSVGETDPPIAQWLRTLGSANEIVEIPEGRPHALGASDMFNPTGVTFKGDKDAHQISYASPQQAALVAELAAIGVRGRVEIPQSPSDCTRCLQQLQDRLSIAQERFSETAALRTGTQSLQDKTAALLMHWFVHGRSASLAKREQQ